MRFDNFRQDIAYAVRGLLRTPGFTLAVVLTLGLGIGANAAMFGIVDQLLFRPPPLLKDAPTAHRTYVYQTNRGVERASEVGRYGRYVDLTKGIRRRLQREMPGASYVAVTPLSDGLGSQTRSWRLGATMFVAFGALALALAALGLYGVIAYNVAQRTHELGVRVALGAQSGDVVRLVVTDGLRVAVVGVVIGTIVALWAGRFVKPLLFDVSPNDPMVFGVVAATLLAVASAASWAPALRASWVDPNVALRAD